MRNILLAYDGSQSSNRALEFAVTLARSFGAELHVLAVARPPEFGTEVETAAMVEKSRRHYEQVARVARGKVSAESVKVHCEVVVGHPAEQIVRYAEKKHIDHIVVGHRGHTLFERWLIGSVARQVIAYAPCAVTVVRDAIPRHRPGSTASRRDSSQRQSGSSPLTRTPPTQRAGGASD